MSWHGIEGHDNVVEQFRRMLQQGRLASTFLFAGPQGVGKRTFALKLTQALLCQTRPAEQLDPCEQCPACLQVQSLSHPDLRLVAKPADKNELPVALFIGDKDHRMREGLCHHLSLKPFMGGRKIAIIDDADDLNEEGANCLLKTLEEPPPNSVLILIGTTVDRQLPTIRSRCQIVRFRSLSPDVLARLLVAEGTVADSREALRVAVQCDGGLTRARELADPGLWQFRAQLLSRLAMDPLPSVSTAREIVAFVEQAGKEAPPRRARARTIIGFVVDFYRQLLRALGGSAPVGDAEMQAAVDNALKAWQRDIETAAACVERSLDALWHLERNSNPATVVECWLDDLAQITSATAALS